MSCNEAKTEVQATSDAVVIAFLEDVTALEKEKGANPIADFKALSLKNAVDSININKDNIKDALAKAKNYKHSVVIVDNHTIVKLVDVNDCKASGSWGACMPMGEGYIKRGALNYKKDYINNIIGLPDAQTRSVYFFN